MSDKHVRLPRAQTPGRSVRVRRVQFCVRVSLLALSRGGGHIFSRRLICCALVLALVLVRAAPLRAACAATGEEELTQAQVHQARMDAKNENRSFEFSSGSLDAAKACADLINRISSLSIGSVSVPGTEELLKAVQEEAREEVDKTVQEACQYAARTSTSWVRGQISTLRASAGDLSRDLVGARVNIANPASTSKILLNTYRGRLRGSLPSYADLPSLR